MIGTAPECLATAREAVEPALMAAVGRLHDASRLVSGYHLGWNDEEGRRTLGGGGKALRPALALLSAAAAGAGPESGIPGAVAVELVHNFSLLHDDVMDSDAERRHRTSAWMAFGVPHAVLAGDALMVLAYEVLLDSGSPHRVEAVRRVTTAASELIRGQGADLTFESRLDVSVGECLTMSAQKTAALLSAASAIGAELAGGGPELIAALAGFGLHLGLAFQGVDDLLGIWGSPQVTGKPVGNDLRQRKKSLPVVAALAAGNGIVDDLCVLLSLATLSDAEVARGTELLEKAGTRTWVEELVERERRAAIADLDRAAIPEEVRTQFIDIADFVTIRDF
ncbi:MAG TPA: polyprenyl synthetase family protein [Actinomycetota bacterium]|nr:polyprenyl synthetase family protein [Actinomycetota bacterium]